MRAIPFVILGIFFLELNSQAQEEKPDAVVIKTVATDKDVVRGVETEIVVTIDYRLQSADEAVLMLGFNSDDPSRFTPKDSTIVKAGTGSVSLKATIVPVDWGERGSFSAIVMLVAGEGVKRETLASAHQAIEVRPF